MMLTISMGRFLKVSTDSLKLNFMRIENKILRFPGELLSHIYIYIFIFSFTSRYFQGAEEYFKVHEDSVLLHCF
jgi:hypothetical protein